MRYDGKSQEYFQPQDSIALSSAGAANIYIVGKNQVVRISVTTGKVYAKFGNDAGMAIASSANIELQSSATYFLNSGDNRFLSIDTPGNCNVILIK